MKEAPTHITNATEADLRDQMTQACQTLERSGLNQSTSGNISVRCGEAILVTPSGVPYSTLSADEMVLMPIDIDDDDPLFRTQNPSSEWRFHRDILRHRPEVAAVVHTHSPNATAMAIHGRSIPAHHYMIAAAGGNSIRCAPYATFGSQQLSDLAIAALEGRKACLLAHHGVICVGDSLARAVWLAREVEELARQYLLACTLGTPPTLDDTQMAEVLERFRSYGLRRRD